MNGKASVRQLTKKGCEGRSKSSEINIQNFASLFDALKAFETVQDNVEIYLSEMETISLLEIENRFTPTRLFDWIDAH